MHIDITATAQMAKSMGDTRLCKCIDGRYRYLHDTVQQGELEIDRIPTTEQFADIFTNPFMSTMYKGHKNNIQICL